MTDVEQVAHALAMADLAAHGCISWEELAAVALEVMQPELVGLREQLARQAELLDAAQLRSIEASNPGINMDGVRAFRAGRALSVPAPPEAAEVTG